MGALLHPTSLPGRHGIGALGHEARRYVDWLTAAKLGLWQVLPIVPPGGGESPYGSPAALCGNPWLIDLDELVAANLLTASELPTASFPSNYVDFSRVYAAKGPALHLAADRLVADKKHRWHPQLRRYFHSQDRVVQAAIFNALHDLHHHQPWWRWPDALRMRDADAINHARKALSPQIDRYVAMQFLFDLQWKNLRQYANERGIRLVGDLPIYVDGDSADTWCHPHLFQLDARGKPNKIAGVPPDYFSAEGQLWGNPLYDWAAMAKDDYAWWIARLERAFAQTDLVRLDHFRGFAAYWSVAARAKDARGGTWQRGPGLALFAALERHFGSLPLIAEDLGDIDAKVEKLRDTVGLPGMRILQFAFGGPSSHPFLPHNHVPHSVVYTGTHDNDTIVGWWRSSPQVHDHARRYLGRPIDNVAYEMLRATLGSVADTAIVPMQDLLGLGSEARMNTPGVAAGNWGWRVQSEALTGQGAENIKQLALLFDRVR